MLLEFESFQVVSEDGSHRTLRDEAVRVFGVLLDIESMTFESYRDEASTLQVNELLNPNQVESDLSPSVLTTLIFSLVPKCSGIVLVL